MEARDYHTRSNSQLARHIGYFCTHSIPSPSFNQYPSSLENRRVGSTTTNASSTSLERTRTALVRRSASSITSFDKHSTRDVEGDDVAALAVAASAASCCCRRHQRRHRCCRRLTLTLPIILLLPLSTRDVEGDDVAALAIAASAASCETYHSLRAL